MLPVRRKTLVLAAVGVAVVGILVALAIPAIQVAREAATRAQSRG